MLFALTSSLPVSPALPVPSVPSLIHLHCHSTLQTNCCILVQPEMLEASWGEGRAPWKWAVEPLNLGVPGWRERHWGLLEPLNLGVLGWRERHGGPLVASSAVSSLVFSILNKRMKWVLSLKTSCLMFILSWPYFLCRHLKAIVFYQKPSLSFFD